MSSTLGEAERTTRTCSNSSVRSHAGQCPATVRVRKLHYTITGPLDAWGNSGKPQPLLVTAEVGLRHPFKASSSEDSVAPDTVHYGLMSKFILGKLGRHEASLNRIGLALWEDLTGWRLDSGVWKKGDGAFLKLDTIKLLSLHLELPKASSLGAAVALNMVGQFGTPETGGASCHLERVGVALTFQGLKVPTLIGVNEYERTKRQLVIANVTVESVEALCPLSYSMLEGIIVDTISESSRQTLEALAVDISVALTRVLRTMVNRRPPIRWQLTIELEKPTAVPMAEAACVELCVNTADIELPDEQ